MEAHEQFRHISRHMMDTCNEAIHIIPTTDYQRYLQQVLQNIKSLEIRKSKHQQACGSAVTSSGTLQGRDL